MKAIVSRDDVRLLVHSFYDKIRADQVLGPIFKASISDEKWPGHLDKMVDFWMGNLFGIKGFKGEPILAHVKADNKIDNKINQEHFAYWIRLWFETLDENFEGEKCQKAKDVARMLTTPMYFAVWENQQKIANSK